MKFTHLATFKDTFVPNYDSREPGSRLNYFTAAAGYDIERVGDTVYIRHGAGPVVAVPWAGCAGAVMAADEPIVASGMDAVRAEIAAKTAGIKGGKNGSR